MWQTIKKILNKNRNAVIIVVENEKPVMVINSFEEYEKSAGQDQEKASEGLPMVEEELEEVNQEIINLQAPQETEMPLIEEPVRDEERADEIRIEDIPLL